MSAHRYELWAGGEILGKYKTLSQALLGAAWRARKQHRAIYVYTGPLATTSCGRLVATLNVI